MKRDHPKRKIYLRIFSLLLAIYLILMLAFSTFFLSKQKKIAMMDLQTDGLYLSTSIERIIKDYVSNNQIIDITKVRKELVNTLYLEPDTELAFFTGDYELVYNTNPYWTVSYTSQVVGNHYYTDYAYINPEDWFSDEESQEIEDYLYAAPKAEKVGDLSGYAVYVEGFWLDNEMMIPKTIYVHRMYADEFNKNGELSRSSGVPGDVIVYETNYENKKGLPYYDQTAEIIPNNLGNPNNEEQNALRKAVINPANLNQLIPPLFMKLEKSEVYSEKVNLFNYRFYWIEPYQRTLEDGSYSPFWTVVGRNVNLWEQTVPTLKFIWATGFIIIIFAFILSSQTYKTIQKRKILEKQRREMVNALAHDLKTPLSIISGYAQNLQENVLAEKREHYIAQIQENVGRMDNIIREMLELSKVESDTFQMNVEEVSLRGLCQEVLQRYKPICDEKGINLQLEGEAVVKADTSLLARVMDNFVINAIENTPEDGNIRISIHDHLLEVYNSGSRIPEEQIEDVWLPFKKGEASRGKTKGTGLGLAIARSILELHHFSYGAKNLDDGVVFWFKFQ
ncbi:sensor histidine kinase [Ureibacillus thermophilus]|uniref:sensor histidine kinase n=1 Tax=Ureibacillus thermophilus TaxID=367743 RepID=UPI003609B19F